MDERPAIALELSEGVGKEGTSANNQVVAEKFPSEARDRIPWWTAVSAGAAPVLLTAGFFVAAALQPASYNPVRDTISALAGQGASDPWVMTSALIAVGTCYLLTALGLRSARHIGRVALAGGGVATLLIAAFHQSRHVY